MSSNNKFSRKKWLRSLRPEPAEALLRKAGIDPMRRAETLTIEEWKRLMNEYYK